MSTEPVAVIRFEFSDTSLSYPLSEIRQWEWLTLDGHDRVRIRAGSEWLVVIGENLLPLRNALDQLRLQVVREFGPRRRPASPQPWVTRIERESSGAKEHASGKLPDPPRR